MKIYIERNNLQLEVIWYFNNVLLYSHVLFAKRPIQRDTAQEVSKNKTTSASVISEW